MNDEIAALEGPELEESTAESIEPVQEEQEQPAPKPSRRKKPKTVTLRNRSGRMVVAIDAEGEGIHLVPRAEVEITEDRLSPDIQHKADLGLIALL